MPPKFSFLFKKLSPNLHYFFVLLWKMKHADITRQTVAEQLESAQRTLSAHEATIASLRAQEVTFDRRSA
jgi:hypothetical protein